MSTIYVKVYKKPKQNLKIVFSFFEFQEQVLANDVSRPIVKLNVSQMSLKHRQDLVNQGLEAGLKWANTHAQQMAKKNPEAAHQASQSALNNFCQGKWKQKKSPIASSLVSPPPP